MNPFLSTDRHQFVRRLTLASGVLLLIVFGAIVVGRVGPEPPAARPEPPSAVLPGSSETDAEKAAEGDASPSGITKAEAFTRKVTCLLFTWDSVAGPEPVTIRGEVVALADPTDEETPGLLVDLDAYLPDEITWRHLGALGARQWIEVDTATVPATWTDAVVREPGLAGTYAVNVAGTRHRESSAAGLTDRTENPVRFAAIVRCAADGPCSLLRLGRLGEPWEG